MRAFRTLNGATIGFSSLDRSSGWFTIHNSLNVAGGATLSTLFSNLLAGDSTGLVFPGLIGAGGFPPSCTPALAGTGTLCNPLVPPSNDVTMGGVYTDGAPLTFAEAQAEGLNPTPIDGSPTSARRDTSGPIGVLFVLGPPEDIGLPPDSPLIVSGSAGADDVVGTADDPFVGLAYGTPAATVAAAIDIKPASQANPINPVSRGVVPVAILGSATFDVADVDVSTLAFGPAGAPLAHRNGPHPKDANHDGDPDLIAHFLTEESGIAPGDEEVCVTGELLDGTPFEGCDAVRTVPPE